MVFRTALVIPYYILMLLMQNSEVSLIKFGCLIWDLKIVLNIASAVF